MQKSSKSLSNFGFVLHSQKVHSMRLLALGSIRSPPPNKIGRIGQLNHYRVRGIDCIFFDTAETDATFVEQSQLEKGGTH